MFTSIHEPMFCLIASAVIIHTQDECRCYNCFAFPVLQSQDTVIHRTQLLDTVVPHELKSDQRAKTDDM